MGRNSKQRRDNKKRLKAKRAKQLTSVEKPDFNRPVLTKLEIPSPFDGLSGEALIEKLDDLSKRSRESVMKHVETLKGMFRQYDPLQFLSIISGYCLMAGAGKDGVERKDSNQGVHQFHLELLQSLLLQLPKEEWGMEHTIPANIDSAIKVLQKLGYEIAFTRLDGTTVDMDGKELLIKQLQHQLQLNTQSVRNWGYFHKVNEISAELYEYFDNPVFDKLGFRISEVLAVFNHMLSSIERKQNERFQNLIELKRTTSKRVFVEKYYRMMGKEGSEAEFIKSPMYSNYSMAQLFAVTLAHMDTKMPAIFTFNVTELSNDLNIPVNNVEKLLKELSYRPGALIKQKTAFMFLDNPVWHKPVIQIDDEEYFCCVPQMLFSFIIPTLDAIIAKASKSKLHARKGSYLEQKVEEIVKRRFPEATTVSGIKWYYEDKLYETDLLTVIDSHIIVIEAKSHSVTKPALRGAADRLRRHVNELIVEPSLQSHRLEIRLNELKDDLTIDDELRSHLPVDLSQIHQIIRVSVTLEDIASLQTNLSRIGDVGWLPDNFKACPTMTLADFEILFDLLEHPVQIIHYLQRRAELEGKFQFVGDELDLMALYQTTFLDLGNIQVDQKNIFNLAGLSALIDRYYMSMGEGIAVTKPRPKISPLFEGVFKMLESRSMPRWSEIGVILNRFPPESQYEIEQLVKRHTKIVRKKWQIEGHKNIVLCHPARSSEFSLAWVLVKNENLDKRDFFIEQAGSYGLEEPHVKMCLVISSNIDTPDVPYNFVGLFER